MLLFFSASAQEAIAVRQFIPDKPLLFSKVPQQSICNKAALEASFDAKAGDTLSIALSPQLTFKGIITEKVQRSPVLLSMNLRALDGSGAFLNITRLSLPDKAPQLKARLMHPDKGDVLLLTKQNDQYLLVKRPQKFLMAD